MARRPAGMGHVRTYHEIQQHPAGRKAALTNRTTEFLTMAARLQGKHYAYNMRPDARIKL